MSITKLKKITSIVISALVLIAGICFIAACLHLFFTGGDKPYSRERVGMYLTYIAAPSILTVIAVIFGAILSYIDPTKDSGIKITSKRAALSRLASRLDVSKCDGEARASIEKEQKTRKILLIITCALILVYTVFSSIIAFDFSRYTLENYNSDIVGTALVILPLAIAVIGIISVFTYLSSSSVTRELELTKAAIAAGAALNAPLNKSVNPIIAKISDNEERIVFAARIAILVVAVTFIVLGVINGGMADVLGKAIRICTECIGLG